MEIILFICLIVLIIISAFFSGSETSMMSLNRYKLRHLAKQNNLAARRAHQLLKRPDRLLGVILIGNTFANIFASAIATMLAIQLFGDIGVVLITVILTLVILIFAEVMPKTVAAYRPEQFAFPASFVLKGLLKIIYPLVWLINTIANSILRLFGLHFDTKKIDPLNIEELRGVVDASKGQLPGRHHNMLLGILDLEKANMEDCLVRKNDIYAINLSLDWPDILTQLITSPYSRVPVYRDNIDNILGVLQLKRALKLIEMPNAQHQDLENLLNPMYYVPESTTLQQQLINFQATGEKFGLVVDEYGELVGLVTVEDIIEEVMGEFTSIEQNVVNDLTQKQPDDSYLVDGSMTIRDVNRDLQMDLPTDGPKTLSGVITEYLEAIPSQNTSVLINGYPIDIMTVKGKAIKWAKIHPKLS